jgi:hypothetical protein
VQLKSLVDRERNEKETFSKQLREVRDDSRRRIDALERRNQELEQDHGNLSAQLKSGERDKKHHISQDEKIRGLEMDKKHLHE